MKKIYLFLVLILAVISAMLASCDANNGTQSIRSSEESVADGEIPLLTIETYGEYTEFISTNEYAGQIVKFDLIKDFGDFKSFVVTSGGYNGDYSQYCYSFVDPYGFETHLMITDTSKIEKAENYPKIEQTDFLDLRSIGNDLRGILRIGDAEYMYVNGDLLWIEWKVGNLSFTLSSDTLLSAYPKQTSETFISNLLSKEKAADCIYEICKRISTVTEG